MSNSTTRVKGCGGSYPLESAPEKPLLLLSRELIQVPWNKQGHRTILHCHYFQNYHPTQVMQTYFILWYKGTWSSCQRRGDLYSLLLQSSHTVQSLSGITYSPHKMRSSRSGFYSLLKSPWVFTEDVWHCTTLDQLCIPCTLHEGMAFILARNSTNFGQG